jgi:hypothetical protein
LEKFLLDDQLRSHSAEIDKEENPPSTPHGSIQIFGKFTIPSQLSLAGRMLIKLASDTGYLEEDSQGLSSYPSALRAQGNQESSPVLRKEMATV